MTCPKCDQPTVTTPAGLQLHPTKSRVGRYLADGTEITPEELRQGVRAHTLHYCPAGPPRITKPVETNQGSLF